MNLEEALRQYARELAKQLLDRRLEIKDGLATMHREVVTPLDHAADVVPWCYLWEGMHPENLRELTDDALAEEVYKVAASFLDSEDSA